MVKLWSRMAACAMMLSLAATIGCGGADNTVEMPEKPMSEPGHLPTGTDENTGQGTATPPPLTE